MHSLANAHSTDDDCTHIIPAHCNLKNTKNQILTICQLQVAFNLVSDCVSWTQHWQQLEGYPQHRDHVGQLCLCWHCWCCHLKMPGGNINGFRVSRHHCHTACREGKSLGPLGYWWFNWKTLGGSINGFIKGCYEGTNLKNTSHWHCIIWHWCAPSWKFAAYNNILSLYFQHEHQATMLNSHHLFMKTCLQL